MCPVTTSLGDGQPHLLLSLPWGTTHVWLKEGAQVPPPPWSPRLRAYCYYSVFPFCPNSKGFSLLRRLPGPSMGGDRADGSRVSWGSSHTPKTSLMWERSFDGCVLPIPANKAIYFRPNYLQQNLNDFPRIHHMECFP